jgi:autotransporter-associated beta strand protein
VNLTGQLIKSTPGTLVVGGSANNFTGTVQVTAGTLQLGSNTAIQGDITVDGGTLDLSSYDKTGANVTLKSGTITSSTGALKSATIITENTGDATLSALLDSLDTTLTINGSGALTLTRANTFGGGTILNAGTLRIGDDSGLGAGTLTINAGGLTSDGATARTLGNDWRLLHDLTFGEATTYTGTLQIDGDGDFGGTTRILTTLVPVTLAGVLSNGGLTKAGASTLTLSGANTYDGGTIVTGGSLNIGHALALGSTSNLLSVGTGSTVDLQGYSIVVAAISEISSAAGTITNSGALASLTLASSSSPAPTSTFSSHGYSL